MKRSLGDNLLAAQKIITNRRRVNAKFATDSANRQSRIKAAVNHYLSRGNIANSDNQVASDCLNYSPDIKGDNESMQDFLESVREVLTGTFGWKYVNVGTGNVHCLPPSHWGINERLSPPPISNERRRELANQLSGNVDEMTNSNARLAMDYIQANDRATVEALIKRATAAIPKLPVGSLKHQLEDTVRSLAFNLNHEMVCPRPVVEKLASLLASTDLITQAKQENGYAAMY